MVRRLCRLLTGLFMHVSSVARGHYTRRMPSSVLLDSRFFPQFPLQLAMLGKSLLFGLGRLGLRGLVALGNTVSLDDPVVVPCIPSI